MKDNGEILSVSDVDETDIETGVSTAVVEALDEAKKEVLSIEDTPSLSLRELLGGDYLVRSFLRNNIWFILFVVALMILYISNRYLAQQEIIEEENLRRELIETKNIALTRCAELTILSRQSSIEKRLNAFGDTTLKNPSLPPYSISLEQ